MKVSSVVVDLSHFSTPRSLHEGLAAIFCFPGWYGMNWDAFWDCMTDSSLSTLPDELIIINSKEFISRLPKEAAKLKEILKDLGKRRPEFSVKWA